MHSSLLASTVDGLAVMTLPSWVSGLVADHLLFVAPTAQHCRAKLQELTQLVDSAGQPIQCHNFNILNDSRISAA